MIRKLVGVRKTIALTSGGNQMKKSFAVLFLAAAAVFGLTAVMAAGQAAAPEKAEARWDGRIVRINWDQSTLDARRGHITKAIHWDSNTKWTKTDKAGKVVDIDPKEVKESDRVICLGSYNDKKEFWATRIDHRAGKSAM
jgi:hypothetical protein